MSHKQQHGGPTSSRVSPPLGALPSQPDSPEVQLPPPEPDLPPIQAVPMTDGTPAACMQKNAKEFLAGNLCRCSGYEGQLRGIQNFIAWKKAQAQA